MSEKLIPSFCFYYKKNLFVVGDGSGYTSSSQFSSVFIFLLSSDGMGSLPHLSRYNWIPPRINQLAAYRGLFFCFFLFFRSS